MTRRAFTIILLICISAIAALAEGKGYYYVSGIVRDSVTFEPIPYVSVTVLDKATGALTNDNGIFEITVPNDAAMLQVACLGYEKQIVPIKKGTVNLYDVRLRPAATDLQDVIVRRKKYTKKNNPAVDFARKLRDMGSSTDPERNDYYNYSKHELLTIALNDVNSRDEGSWLFKKFPFLWDHVDTSEVSGKPILNIMVKEKTSNYHFRNKPKMRKEVVTGLRQDGIDEITDQGSMMTLLEDVLREIDLYDNDINILQNRFVSPLSRIAPDFYKFYLTDTVEIDNEKCIVLSFYPHNTAAFGFTGQVFVPVNDSTMFIKKVTMRTPRNINLNFINNLYISQEFDRAEDGSRLKRADDMTMEMSITKGSPGLYVRRNVAYNNHNFDIPQDIDKLNNLGYEIIEEGAKMRTPEFWSNQRQLTVTNNEDRVALMMQRLRENKVYYYFEKGLKILVTGYVNTGNPSKFDYGPVNTTISHNAVEGWRLRAGGMTTANLSKRIFARGYVAYGTKDRKWKYHGELEYSFHDKTYHSREFPIHSVKVSSLYDIDQIGQNYMFTNNDNIFLSLKRQADYNVTYHNLNKIDYTLELANNFSVTASLRNEMQHESPWVPFVNGYGDRLGNYGQTGLKIELRYAPGEKYYQTKSYRIPINLDAPVFAITHTIAPQGWLGSVYGVNKTEASVQKRFWLSAFGFVDLIAKGGHVWSKSPFPNLLIANANLSYTIQPESFACMNAMEFINDSYAMLDATYWLNGALLNLIPGVKQLRLREALSFRGMWGHLSQRNDPDYNKDLLVFPKDCGSTRLTNKPYMEASVGLDNIFKCLRIDYVWRLSYLDVPYRINRHGLRVAFHMTF